MLLSIGILFIVVMGLSFEHTVSERYSITCEECIYFLTDVNKLLHDSTPNNAVTLDQAVEEACGNFAPAGLKKLCTYLGVAFGDAYRKWWHEQEYGVLSNPGEICKRLHKCIVAPTTHP